MIHNIKYDLDVLQVQLNPRQRGKMLTYKGVEIDKGSVFEVVEPEAKEPYRYGLYQYLSHDLTNETWDFLNMLTAEVETWNVVQLRIH
jgi:hypothetical protein